MTKAELQKSHDAMARFLVERCRESDKWAMRSPQVERVYIKARKLIEQAGFKYGQKRHKRR